mmetsp:Transcript_29531/g.28712  ORF Transcript_29531/g.28712 Transcript_29531/m.28712 type:complete len:86 (+) Transcript_29531:203-460(+)|eukprot:CAMPEP_0170550478 /NCGR_PEP_ID=MMETSP0211-20121228/8543_1 /TAXON_ID=311385 /ORGANISM="Pseudokeronopsis sp., Strain OXSARD2" /LENGTH=85 /DNA_ID=CAMNT_0010857057 /DNA_START=188 /DNA_END=445 /DNA_ORIENTATION=+
MWPQEKNLRAFCDQMLEWNQNHLRPQLFGVISAQLLVISKEEQIKPEVMEFLKIQKKPVLESLETFLERFEGDFLCGNHLSIADI